MFRIKICYLTRIKIIISNNKIFELIKNYNSTIVKITVETEKIDNVLKNLHQQSSRIAIENKKHRRNIGKLATADV